MINIKSAIASNTSNIHNYKSTKRAILNWNANIFVNQKQIKIDLIIKHMLVVLHNIQIPRYKKCVVIDRYITSFLIREVFHLDIAIICWFRVIRDIFYIYWSLHSWCLKDFWKPFWTRPKICLSVSMKKLSSAKKQNLWLGTTLLKCWLLGFPNYKMSD